MNIQPFIDRKREAGALEHEGNKTDWGLWQPEEYFIAVASELLDALAYIQKLCEIEKGDTAFITDAMSHEITLILRKFPEHMLEAACREAEEKVNKSIFNCPYCNEVKQEAENG